MRNPGPHGGREEPPRRDVGCGHRKVSPSCIGVDLIARGDKGEHGVVAKQTSVADIQASGDDLHIFGDGELDYVVARYNLEHYVDVVKTLGEWRRVLKPGGVMAILVPDERAGDTVYLDPTHKLLFALPDFLYDDRVLPRTKRYHASFGPTSTERQQLAATYPPQYSFLTWKDYVGDIKQSWFAISPKGAGYDCQRHYEILGQAVLCIFMDEGAPPLLRKCFRDGHNCLTFSNAEELRRKMDQCADPGRLIEQAREDLLSTHLASRRVEELVSVMVSKTLASGKPGWLNRLEWCSWVARATARHGHFRPHP